MLVGIAVPSYDRWVTKSRQTEAKANLASAYSVLKSFRVQHNAYTTRFDAMGFNPDGVQQYRIGFKQDCVSPTCVDTLGTSTCIETLAISNGGPGTCSANFSPNWTHDATAAASDAPGGQVYDASRFGVGASRGTGANVDSWSIDENKVIKSNGT